MIEANYTTRNPDPGEAVTAVPEFGRVRDVERLFGIKRGTLYNLLNARAVKGCVLRVRGKSSGVRLIDLDSVRAHIKRSMQNNQEAA